MKLPKPTTLTGRALYRLMKGKLTHRQFQDITGTHRLSEYIRVLRADYGLDIDTEMKPVVTRDHGRKTTFGIYSIQRDSARRVYSSLGFDGWMRSVEAFELS